MGKKITDVNDYVDKLRWVSHVERRRQTIFESKNREGILMLLQIHELENGDFNNNSNKKWTLFDIDEINTRWREIYHKIRVDPNLD